SGNCCAVESVRLEASLQLKGKASHTSKIASGGKVMAATFIDEAHTAIPVVVAKIVEAPGLHDPNFTMGQVAQNGVWACIIEISLASGLCKCV
ncbi:hypothetical protein CEY02_19970, partial [Bacillus pumilus]